MKHRFTLLLVLLLSVISVKGQDYLDDIMFQSFGWDEYSQSRHTSEGGFYEYYNSRAGNLKAMGFDMIWLPPPSASTGGVGYFPTEWFNFSQTSWGSEAQLKKMLANMNARGLYPIADVVVNHRSGTTGWTDFTNPTWGCETICSNDDAANPANVYTGCRPSGAADTGEEFKGSRDLDHTNLTVQNGVKDFLSRLKALGFKGWRWDVAKGFSASYFGNYINDSKPYYSVGEFWDGNVNALKNWINGTYSGGATISGAFDFSLYYTLSKIIQENPTNQYSTEIVAPPE
jgi:glycosidase